MPPQTRTADRLVARQAGSAKGVATRRELLAAGVTPDEIRHRLESGALRPEYRGVYRVGHSAPSPEATYMAAVKACGDGAALSGQAAAWLWRLVKAATAAARGHQPTPAQYPRPRHSLLPFAGKPRAHCLSRYSGHHCRPYPDRLGRGARRRGPRARLPRGLGSLPGNHGDGAAQRPRRSQAAPRAGRRRRGRLEQAGARVPAAAASSEGLPLPQTNIRAGAEHVTVPLGPNSASPWSSTPTASTTPATLGGRTGAASARPTPWRGNEHAPLRLGRRVRGAFGHAAGVESAVERVGTNHE